MTLDELMKSSGGNLSVVSLPNKPTPLAPPVQTPQSSVTFPAREGENPFIAGLKTLGNIPSSLFNFAKGLISYPFQVGKQAIEAGKELSQTQIPLKDILTESAKAFPGEVAKTAESFVPPFFRHLISGNLNEAQKAMEEDPVGTIAPILIIGREGAYKVGRGAEFDSAISKIAEKPLEIAQRTAEKVGGGIAATGKGVLGLTTGAGGESVKQAFQAGQEGGVAGEAFKGAIRGTTSPQEIATHARTALDTLYENRSAAYKANLQQVPPELMEGKLTLKGLKDTATKSLKSIGLEAKGDQIDFSSRPSLDKKGIQTVINAVYNWKDFTPLGINQLVQEIEGFRKGGLNLSPADNRYNFFIDRTTDNISKYLEEKVPEIKTLNQQYSKQTSFIKEIQRDFSLGDTKSLETGLNKLSLSLRKDNQFKLDLLNQMKDETGIDLAKEIAGFNMRPLFPKGGILGIGSWADAALILTKGLRIFTSPSALIEMAATSPRIVGEMLRGLGVVSNRIRPLVNAIKNISTAEIPTLGQVNTEKLKGMPAGLSIEDVSKKAVGGIPKTMTETIPKDLQPLAEEAKKYKSAKEFVKAIGKRVSINFSSLSEQVKNDISSELFDSFKPQFNFRARFDYGDIQNALDNIKVSQGTEKVDSLIKQFGLQDRDISPIQVRNLTKILKESGELDPVIVNGRELVDGGHRIVAYKTLGKTDIPVIDISNIYKAIKENPSSILDPYQYGLKSFSQPKSQLTDFYNQATKGVSEIGGDTTPETKR